MSELTDNDRKILERLPLVLQRIADIAGIENALRIAKEFGGEEVFIPKLDSLYREVRDEQIRTDYDNGKLVRELVRKYSLTERHIYNILGTQPEDAAPTLPFLS